MNGVTVTARDAAPAWHLRILALSAAVLAAALAAGIRVFLG